MIVFRDIDVGVDLACMLWVKGNFRKMFNSDDGFFKIVDIEKGNGLVDVIKRNNWDLYNRMRWLYVKPVFDFGNCEIVSIVPNTKCLGKCVYCYAKNVRVKDVEIDIDVLINRLNELRSLKTAIVYGGEPFLYSGIEKLLKYLCRRGVGVNVVTGLIGVDYEFVKYVLNRYKEIRLTVSVDVPVSVTRFGMSVKFVKELVGAFGNRVGLRGTLTKETFDIVQYCRFVEEELGMRGYNFSIETVSDDYEIISFDFMYEKVCEFIRWLDKDEKRVEKAVRIGGINKVLRMVNSSGGGIYMNLHGDCSNLVGQITIGWDGEWWGCSEIVTYNDSRWDKYKLNGNGYISECSLERRRKLHDICYSCELAFLCGGDCYIMYRKNRCNWMKLNILTGIYLKLKYFN